MRRYHVIIAVIAAVLVTPGCSSTVNRPQTVTRTVTVTHGTVAFVGTTPAQQLTTESDLSAFLQKLYTLGFVRPEAKGPTPAPDDAPLRTIAPLFAPGARAKLESEPGVFALGPHLDLLTGHVAYNGGITHDGSVATALIALSFTGTGSRTHETTTVVTFSQSGTMTLQRAETGWFVRSFDLKLALQPPPPTPTPT